MVEDAQGDVVHTLIVTTDDDGFEKVLRFHGEPNLLFFRAIRAGLTQREKKRAPARATSVQNVFDVLADTDEDDHADNDEFRTKPTRCGSQSKTADETTSYNRPEVYVNIHSDREVSSIVLPVKVAPYREPMAIPLRVLPVRHKRITITDSR